jgi:hypothetical protein
MKQLSLHHRCWASCSLDLSFHSWRSSRSLSNDPLHVSGSLVKATKFERTEVEIPELLWHREDRES